MCNLYLILGHGISYDLFVSEVQYVNIEKVLENEKEGIKLTLWKKLKEFRGHQQNPISTAGSSQVHQSSNSADKNSRKNYEVGV